MALDALPGALRRAVQRATKRPLTRTQRPLARAVASPRPRARTAPRSPRRGAPGIRKVPARSAVGQPGALALEVRAAAPGPTEVSIEARESAPMIAASTAETCPPPTSSIERRRPAELEPIAQERWLLVDHVDEDGPPTAANLRIRCRAIISCTRRRP